MTRETKIGLLVGLAFIIVVGILINDYRASSMQPPPAALMNTAQDVRDSNNALAMRRMAPLPERDSDVRVPLSHQVEVGGPRRNPDIQGSSDRIRIVPPSQGTRDLDVIDHPTIERTPPAIVEDREMRPDEGTSGPGREMDLARRPDEQTEDVTPRMFALREYKAEPGDTISRMARKFLGSGSKENLDAIVKVNPELKANPNKIVAGIVYKIPTQESGVTTVQPQQPIVPPAPPTADETVTYTTKPGDSLWKIANTQCGSGSMAVVNKIRELNKDVVKGDVVKPNMTLKLPKKSN